jgi:hypothetical protein
MHLRIEINQHDFTLQDASNGSSQIEGCRRLADATFLIEDQNAHPGYPASS